MTSIQEKAILLIQQLPDDKIQAIIDEIMLTEFIHQERVSNKKKAFLKLEKLDLDLPEDFDADSELAKAMEEKYDITS